MKKKVRIKFLPKAQFAGQPSLVLTPQQKDIWYQNQNMFGTPPQKTISVPDYIGSTNTTPSITEGMIPFSQTQTQPFNAPNTFNPFASATMPMMAPSVTPLLTDVDQFNEPYGPLTESNYYANVAEQYTASPAGTTFDDNNAFAPGYNPNLSTQTNGLDLSRLQNIPQGAGFIPFMQSALFANLGRRNERNQAEGDFRNRFLSDVMYAPLPSDYSGTRGDYVTNQGLGINFRPDEAVYGQFGKIAKYGGQMKRKIKITGLPQQEYGGTQNKASVDEMYPYNSNVRRAAYSDMLDGNSEESVRQYAQEVPREIANIEAEKGETIVKPLDNGLLGMYKIGGKRHYEGGTPLQASPNDFIFSDTKDMKIKDPAILESFGMKYKKGGFTPAKISKKFNLNDPSIQKTLNDPNADYLQKATAERMYDNYLSQLGKLALVQEARKGFPQGAPDIAMPYMQKVGMDPSMFMPDVMTPQDASFQMGKAQWGNNPLDPNVLMQRPPSSDEFYNNLFTPSPQAVTQPAAQPAVAQPAAQQVSQPNNINQTSSFDPASIYGSESYITKYGKPSSGKVRVMLDPNASYEDKVRLAEEATTLGFGKGTKAPVQQGRTEGYKYFYAGLTPSDFEKRYLQGFMDMEDVESLTPIERRKKLFSELGIEASEEQLSDPKSLYNSQEWLKNTFYPAFKKKLPQDQFRSVMGDDFMFGLEHFDNIPKRKTPAPADSSKTPAPGPRPNIIPDQGPQKADPGKYYIQDLMNTALAGADRLGIKKYLPYDAGMPAPALMDPTFYDPSRELAAIGEMANMVTQNLAQFVGPQALSSRASQIQANAAKSVGDTLSRYNNLNVGVANQFEQGNKALINDFNIKNALAKSNYNDRMVIANQQFDNAKRAANNRLLGQTTNAFTNKAMTQMLNSMYPEFAVDPTVGGEMIYIPSQRTYDGSSSPSANLYSDVPQNIQALRKQFENDPDFQKLDPKQKLDVLAKFMPRESSMTRRVDPRQAFLMNMMRGRRG